MSTATIGPAEATPGAEPMTRAQIRVLVIGIMFALALAAFDQTVIVTALPTIAADLGSAEKLSWVVTAYLLTSTATAPLYGKFSDSHGRRTALLLAMGLFVAGSVACALAPSMTALVVARGLQGIGAGGLIAIPMTVIGDIIPPRERGRYQAYIAGVYASASLGGPVIGGSLAEYFHWTLIFWMNIPIAAVAFAVAGPAMRRLTVKRQARRIDLLGAILLVAATSMLLLALTWAGNLFGWMSATTIGLLAAATVASGLFAFRVTTAVEPIIPVGVLANPVVAAGVAASFFAMGAFVGLTMAIPLYFELVRGLSASEAGIAVIPYMIGTTFGAMASGRIMGRTGRYKKPPLVGLSIAIVSLAVISMTFERLPDVPLALSLALVTLGLGTVLPVSTVAVQNAVARDDMGTATALNTFCRQLGGAFVVAVFGAILVAGGAGNAVLARGDPGAVDPALGAAFAWIFIGAAASLAAAMVAILLIEDRPLRGADDPRHASPATDGT